MDKISEGMGSGPEGQVIPGDLDDVLTDEAAALGNGEDAPTPEAPAFGNGAEVRKETSADEDFDEGFDWGPIDRHSDRIIGVLGKLWEDSEQKAEITLGKLLHQTEENLEGKFRGLRTFVDSRVGMAGREQAAAAWRGPAEALRLLGGVMTGLSQKAGQEAIESGELNSIFPVLKMAEELLQRASQHEDGKLPVIDEGLGGTGTFGARAGAVAKSVGDAVALAEKMIRGTEAPSRMAIAVRIAGCIVEVGGVFGAEGEDSEFVRRVERLRQERAGPVEGAESNDVRAFRADFGKEVERLRKAMRWRERGIWAAGLAVCLLLGWGAGISGLEFSFAGRFL